LNVIFESRSIIKKGENTGAVPLQDSITLPQYSTRLTIA